MARCDAPPFLHPEERVLDEVADPIQIPVVLPLRPTVRAGRDDGNHPHGGRPVDDLVGVVAPVGQKVAGPESRDQR